MLPFYWMIATSLKDVQSASQTPPTWLPLATHYYAPAPPASSRPPTAEASVTIKPDKSASPGEIRVGLLADASKPWDVLRKMPQLKVAPIDHLNDKRVQYTVPGSSIRRVRRPQWENYIEAWNAPAKGNPENPVTFTRYFFVSVVTSLVTTIGTLLTSILAAYAFAKMEFRGKNIFFFFVLATMMVPAQVLLIPDFLILAPPSRLYLWHAMA